MWPRRYTCPRRESSFRLLPDDSLARHRGQATPASGLAPSMSPARGNPSRFSRALFRGEEARLTLCHEVKK
jgi:hypothetical protein